MFTIRKDKSSKFGKRSSVKKETEEKTRITRRVAMIRNFGGNDDQIFNNEEKQDKTRMLSERWEKEREVQEGNSMHACGNSQSSMDGISRWKQKKFLGVSVHPGFVQVSIHLRFGVSVHLIQPRCLYTWKQPFRETLSKPLRSCRDCSSFSVCSFPSTST